LLKLHLAVENVSLARAVHDGDGTHYPYVRAVRSDRRRHPHNPRSTLFTLL